MTHTRVVHEAECFGDRRQARRRGARAASPSATCRWTAKRGASRHGDYKGTARQSVEPQLAAGQDVLLEIDWQGAAQVKRLVPDALSVFILPPSREALESRMRNRGQDSEETIQRRLAAAREEMSHYDEFDYVIVNEDFETAVTEMQAIFIGSRQRRHVQQQRHAALISALLAG